jgi:ParB-like chromosome segregation protein Spo0J
MSTPATSKPTTEHRLLDWFKPDEREIARHDDPEQVRLLGLDMQANGQLQPVAATEDGRMIFGHGRLLAARSAGIKTLETKLYPSSMPDTQFRLIRAAENLQRKDLSGFRKWQLCAELMCANPWQMKDLAEHLHLDPSMVTRLLSPSRCTEAWQTALKEGKVGISDCYAASKLEPSEQAGLLALKLAGASRDTIEQEARKSRNGSAETVRVQKVKCTLPSGVTVVVAGEGVSLDESIKALTQAIKEMKRARDLGYTARTFAAAMKDMKDKAKKG